MKKSLLVLGICSLFTVACSSGDSSSSQDSAASTDQASTATQSSATASTASSKGAELISKADCVGCHNDKNKIVGPSYANVAAKYTEKDTQYLVSKIKAGGKGVWGDVPMTPHPNLSDEDATEMVKYILSVK